MLISLRFNCPDICKCEAIFVNWLELQLISMLNVSKYELFITWKFVRWGSPVLLIDYHFVKEK